MLKRGFWRIPSRARAPARFCTYLVIVHPFFDKLKLSRYNARIFFDKMKNLYRITILYPYQTIFKYRYAHSPKQARLRVIKEIATEQNISEISLFKYFKENPHAIMVETETEFEEVM